MRKIFLLFLFLSCVSVQYSSAVNSTEGMTFYSEIEEVLLDCDNISVIFDYVDDDQTLVVFDVDETIFRTKQMLGSDKWAYYEGDKFINACKDVEKGLALFRPTWVEVQKAVDVTLVDSDFNSILIKLKDLHCPIMGFTARGLELVSRTKVQLDSVGVDLTANCYYDKTEIGDGFVFEHGVLFVGIGQDKGVLLRAFFDKIGKKPRKIVFIDDRLKNIDFVKKMCRKDGISFVGIRYGAIDPIAKQFVEAIGDVQLDYLRKHGTVISDAEASKMLGVNA